ncbi:MULTISPECIES: hypothetical protein [unclassified Streptomyces]|uniref:hypothetical protein n=1 Tax=unclassified Streptomyces TaxID=2593676 RepID=UPI002E2BA177|nr:hypothetical protein [Streptomyces sp. NBC_00285]
MPEATDIDMPLSEAAKLLHGLMEVLYLSTACALGHHTMCRGVDEFRSLVCCCVECEHADVRTVGPTSAGVPLLHLANTEADRLDSHVYTDGEALGVRADLVHALEKTLDETGRRTREAKRRRLAVQLGIAACLTFAPRSL